VPKLIHRSCIIASTTYASADFSDACFATAAYTLPWCKHAIKSSLIQSYVAEMFAPCPACSGPVVAMVLEHPTAISTLRYMLGPTDPSKGVLQDGSPGTLRNKYGDDLTRNGLHGSADYAAAQREISLFFPHFASFDDDAVDEEQMHATAAQAAADAAHHHQHHGHRHGHRGHHDQHDPEHDEQMIDDFLMETYMADLSDYEPGEFDSADGAASSGSEHGEL
jgi:hypothetical protein